MEQPDENPIELPKDLTKDLPRSSTSKILAELPEHLKDRKNYKKIMKAILNAGATKHSHGEMSEWNKCFHCQRKQNDRLLMMKSLGFQSKAHFMVFQKIHEEINRRVPLPKYNSKV